MMYQCKKQKGQEQGREKPKKSAPAQRGQCENIPGYLPQRKSGDVAQFLRLRINDDPDDTEQFERLRGVDVSPQNTVAVSNRPAGDRLQQANTPSVFGRSSDDQQNALSEYGPPALRRLTLARKEDIILEGHGSEVGMEGYGPRDMAQKAAEIIQRCGYTQDNPWQGRLVLLGCDTGRFAESTAAELNRILKYHVIVIGTQRNISVNETPGGAMYAEDEWQREDPDAPVNLNELIEFNRITTNLFEQMRAISDLVNGLNADVIKQCIAFLNDSNRLTDFGTTMDTLKREFQNVYSALGRINVPTQPNDIIFPQGRVPAQIDHYRGAAVQGRIPIGAAVRVDDVVQNLLNALSIFISCIPNSALNNEQFNLFCKAFRIFTDAIEIEDNNINSLCKAFRIARHRRIDFQNLKHIILG